MTSSTPSSFGCIDVTSKTKFTKETDHTKSMLDRKLQRRKDIKKWKKKLKRKKRWNKIKNICEEAAVIPIITLGIPCLGIVVITAAPLWGPFVVLFLAGSGPFLIKEIWDE